MRRALKLGQLLQQSAGVATEGASCSQAAAVVPLLARQLSGPAHGAPAHGAAGSDNPLEKVMPMVAKLPRQVVSTAAGVVGTVAHGVATSGSAKSLVSSFTEKVIIGEKVLKLSEIDVPFWTYWLSSFGYTSHAGFQKFASAVRPKIAELEPSKVAALIAAFQKVGYYDKDLYTALAANISDNYTKYDTEDLVKIVSTYAQFGHYSTALFDDIADSITYCNHYMAPLRTSASDVAAALSAYAKYKHERADLFNTLSRGLSELSLGKLKGAERKNAVLSSLRALNTFNFYPEPTDALLYVANAHPEAFSAEELAEVKKIQTAAEDAVGGKLVTFNEAAEGHDAAYWYSHNTHAPSAYNLYVFRDSLVHKQYSPASIRPAK